MKYTLLLVAVTLGLYFVFSTALIYIPSSALFEYGFSAEKPIPGIITYSLLHVSPSHLAGNILLLIAVGVIAEKKLRARDFFIIYFASGLAGGAFFVFTNPNTALVGASAAVSGMVTAAFLIDIKKAFVGIVLFVLALSITSPFIADFTESQYALLMNESVKLEDKFNATQEKLIIAINTNDTNAIQNLTVQRNETAKQIVDVYKKKENTGQGLEREKKVVTSPIIHLLGALTGLAYIILFRRDILWELPSQVLPRKYLSAKSRKKSKAKRSTKRSRSAKTRSR